MVDSIFTVKICKRCGTSNLDGDPDFGIPFSKVEPRKEHNNEMLCEPCAKMDDIDRVREMLSGKK